MLYIDCTAILARVKAFWREGPLPSRRAIYWTLPPGSFFGSFFKGKIEKMKVMGPFEIWNKENVARTPLVAATSPPPPFALFGNVTFSVPKRETPFWVDCADSKVPLTPKLNKFYNCFNFLSTNFHFHFSATFTLCLPTQKRGIKYWQIFTIYPFSKN